MDGRHPAQRATDVRFEQYVDERAALEILVAEPAVEHIEDREQAGDRICRATFDLEPIAGPDLFPTIEKGYRQIELGFEVAIKARFGAARLCKNRIDADLVDPPAGKEFVGRSEQPLACADLRLPQISPRRDTRSLQLYRRRKG